MRQAPAHAVEVHFLRRDQAGTHQPIAHTEHTLTYHVAGTFQLEQGTTLTAAPGMFTLLPAGVPHRGLGGNGSAFWLVRFCPVCHGLDEHHPLMEPFRSIRLGALPQATLPGDRHAFLVDLLRHLNEEVSRHTPETAVVVTSLLNLILAEVCRAVRVPMPHDTHPQGSLVADALAYIQAHCLAPISPRDVARAVHRSPAHVTAVLRRVTGFTTGQWITAGRLSEAAKRLVYTDDALEAVADGVGWQDVTHFIRQFRRAHGMTPAAWRTAARRNKGCGHVVPNPGTER